MIETAALVSLIASLGWLVLSWRNHRATMEQVGWSGSKQVRMVLVWIAIFAGMYLLVSVFSA